ncbi:MAG TPA: hypothetical protein VFW86_06945, partial [Candidatus Limnocylindrales bacterium]|nr:hypothetical protein [Candidatus Limnocylindrales bacterium]
MSPRPNPGDNLTNLSEQDLERRLAGDAGLGGPVPEPPPPVVPAADADAIGADGGSETATAASGS